MTLRRSAPSGDLKAELSEVSVASDIFLAAIDGANFLPEEFPEDALRDIAHALQLLPEGTASGAMPPLEYARLKLPRLRRYAVGPLDPQIESDTPYLERGGPIDVALAALIVSVTTALDAYRESSRNENEQFSIEEAEILNSDGSLQSVRSAADQTIAASDVSIEDFAVLSTRTSKSAEKLQRNINDTNSLARIVRAETKSIHVIPKVFSWLGSQLAQIPRHLKNLGEAITMSADVSEPFFHAWSKFNDGALKLLLNAIRDLGAATVEAGKTLEAASNAKAIGNKGAASLTPENYKKWLLDYVEQRGMENRVSIGLLTAEIQHQSGLSAKDFSKLAGKKNFAELVSSVPGLIPIFAYWGYVEKIDDTSFEIEKERAIKAVLNLVDETAKNLENEYGEIHYRKLLTQLKKNKNHRRDFAIACGIAFPNPKEFLSNFYLIEYINLGTIDRPVGTRVKLSRIV